MRTPGSIIDCGKGHENTQIYKNKIIKISDKQIVKNQNQAKIHRKKAKLFTE